MAIEDKKEASKTYLEQIKLLITLASTFIVAPAVFYKDLITFHLNGLLWMEISFIASVISGYVAVATISGTQFNGDYDINRKATRISSLVQLGLFLLGLVIFILSLRAEYSNQQNNKAAIPQDTVKNVTIINNYSQQSDVKEKRCKK